MMGSTLPHKELDRRRIAREDYRWWLASADDYIREWVVGWRGIRRRDAASIREEYSAGRAPEDRSAERWYRTPISFVLWETGRVWGASQTCRIQNEIPPARCISTRTQNWSPRGGGERGWREQRAKAPDDKKDGWKQIYNSLGKGKRMKTNFEFSIHIHIGIGQCAHTKPLSEQIAALILFSFRDSISLCVTKTNLVLESGY